MTYYIGIDGVDADQHADPLAGVLGSFGRRRARRGDQEVVVEDA
jgi:hypothetical protein